MLKAEDFLALLKEGRGAPVLTRLGTIPADYTSGRPTILFDGESTISTKTYYRLTSYATPAPGDRVLLAKVGHSWVVLGDIV